MSAKAVNSRVIYIYIYIYIMTYLKNIVSKSIPAQAPHKPAQAPWSIWAHVGAGKQAHTSPLGASELMWARKCSLESDPKFKYILSVCNFVYMPLVARSRLTSVDFRSNWPNAFMQPNQWVTGDQVLYPARILQLVSAHAHSFLWLSTHQDDAILEKPHISMLSIVFYTLWEDVC